VIVTNDNLESAVQTLSHAPVIAFDLETTDLSAHRGTICGVALAIRKGDGNTNSDFVSYYFPCGHGEGDNLSLVQIVEVLRDLFIPQDRTWLTWNGKFDYQWTLELGLPIPTRALDVQLAAHLLDENCYSFGLKEQAARLLGAEAKDAEDALLDELKVRGYGASKSKAKGQMWKLPAELVAPYAEMDVILTYRLHNLFQRPLHYWKLYDLWIDISKYMRVIIDLEREGMMLDLSRVQSLIDQSEQGMQQTSEALFRHFGFPINPNSPKDVLKAIRMIEPTIMSTDKENLTPLVAKHPIVDEILLYREWSKVKGAYYEPFRELSVGGVLHPNLWMTGTATGRFSCSDPNLQAIPRKAEDAHGLRPRSYVKSVFIARPDMVLIQADYKQAEVYLGAHYANAKLLTQMLKEGVDVHTETAKQLGIPRFAAKRLNFSMQYGIGVDALAGDLGVSQEEASEYLDRYNKLHPEMKQLYFRMGNEGKRNGHIRLFTGRKRSYNEFQEAQKLRVRHSPAHKASSNLIQGAVGEVMRISSMQLAEKLPEARQRLHVHDSIMFEAPRKDAKQICVEIERLMTEHTKQFTVPLKVDIEIGTRWIDVKPLSEFEG
jgi:DNA polymerase I